MIFSKRISNSVSCPERRGRGVDKRGVDKRVGSLYFYSLADISASERDVEF